MIKQDVYAWSKEECFLKKSKYNEINIFYSIAILNKIKLRTNNHRWKSYSYYEFCKSNLNLVKKNMIKLMNK